MTLAVLPGVPEVIAMFPSNTATWTCIALLTPFWWGLGLITLAFIGDVWPRWRVHLFRFFDLLERTPGEQPKSAAIEQASPKAFAA
jgi:hypothetical protein